MGKIFGGEKFWIKSRGYLQKIDRVSHHNRGKMAWDVHDKGSPWMFVANVVEYDFVESGFKLQSFYYIEFWINFLQLICRGL